MKRLLILISICLVLAISFSCESNAADKPKLRFLTTEAMINGQPAKFVIDTCWPAHFSVFPRTIERLGLGARAVDGTDVTQFTLSTPDWSYEITASVVDVPLKDVDGIIGWPALHGVIWQIDWNSAGMVALPKVPERRDGWSVFNINPDSLDKARIEFRPERKLTMLIDTGAHTGLSLSPNEWLRFNKTMRAAPRTLCKLWTVKGVFTVEEVWADEISVGPVNFVNATVTPTVFHRDRESVHIGLEALAQFEVVFDLVDYRLYLKPRTFEHRSIRYNRLGAEFVSKKDSQYLIAQVLDDSPAYRCGLRNGDELLMINDKDMRGAEEFGVWDWSAPAGTQYAIRVSRDGEIKSLVLTLEELFSIASKRTP